MFAQKWLAPFWSLLALLAVVSPVRAGGWTVVTLDDLPAALQAGTPRSIGFQVMQHGVHPLVLAPGEVSIQAHHPASGERVTFTAQQDAQPGHYTVEIVLPTEGAWTWEVQPGGFPPAPMPELTVGSGLALPVASAGSGGQGPMWRQVAIQLLTYLLEQAEAAPVSQAAPGAPQVADGQRLFVAKGCATCHFHAAAQVALSIQAGPDLTSYKVIPDYVRTWLKDPAAIKPNTLMPRINLNEQEIDTLVLFLSSNGQ